MGYDGDDAIVVLLLPPCVASYNYSSTLYYYALTYSGHMRVFIWALIFFVIWSFRSSSYVENHMNGFISGLESLLF
jgi:hypothetical protein